MKPNTLATTFFLALFATRADAQDASLIYQNTVGSTVTVYTANGFGSGFFIEQDVIATNYHVIENAFQVNVGFNNTSSKYKVDVIATDTYNDLALLKISGLSKKPLEISTDQTTPGEKIFVIGTPKGLQATISDGIVSGIRSDEGRELIQITAPISPGSSGGPVINKDGEVIGVCVMQLKEGQNLNFAIPYKYLNTLKTKKKETTRPGTKPPVAPAIKGSANKGSGAYVVARNSDNLTALTLDYITKNGNETVFCFTYTNTNGKNTLTTIWMDNYRLFDPSGGRYYEASVINLPVKDAPKAVFDGESARFNVIFRNLPASLTKFDLVEADCSETSFCFTGIDLSNYSQSSYNNADVVKAYELKNQGKLSVYSRYGSSGEINFWLANNYTGKISNYVSNNSFIPSCGDESTITLTVTAGSYQWKASDKQYTWQDTKQVVANTCNSISLIIK
jgi:hypothetical protein